METFFNRGHGSTGFCRREQRAFHHVTRLRELLCRSQDDQRADSFLKQRISMALRVGNAACVLATRDFKRLTISRAQLRSVTFQLQLRILVPQLVLILDILAINPNIRIIEMKHMWSRLFATRTAKNSRNLQNLGFSSNISNAQFFRIRIMCGSDTEGEDVSEVPVRPNFVWKELKTKGQLVKKYFLAELKDPERL